MPGRRLLAFAAPLAAVVALAGVSHPAMAASVSAQIFLGSQILGLNEQPQVGPAPGPLSDSVQRIQGPAALGTGLATAVYDVQYGRIRVSATLDVFAPGTLATSVNIDSGATATAGWVDSLTFSAPGLAGTTGYYRPRLDVHGSFGGQAAGTHHPYESSASGSFVVTVSVSTALPGRVQQRSGYCIARPGGPCEAAGDPFGSWLLDPVPFVFGRAFTLDVSASAGTSVRAVEGGSGNATALLGNTIEWLGISEVTDASGNPIANFTLTSQSQFDYAAAAVPEPSTALLVGAGLAGLSRAARLSSGRRPPARAARSRSSGLPQDRGR